MVEQLAVHHELGFGGIELRNVDDQPLATIEPTRRRHITDEVVASGLRVVALDSTIGNWATSIVAPVEPDLQELDVLAEIADRVASRYVRVMSYPNAGLSDAEWGSRVLDRFGLLTERAATYGLTLVHENCSGWAARDPTRARALLDHVASPALRLLFDLGNPITHGDDPLEYLRPVLDAVVHVHIKDVVYDRANGTAEFTMPGHGSAPLQEVLDLLAGVHYAGAVSLEPHVAHVHHLGDTAPADLRRTSYLAYAREFLTLVGCGR
ncbi:sugar phosphate isomerase/epimerase family protein [Nocardioides sp.]|uniref:sugar phosphate isomerase/epimerase family protein n=1 Tax=Nocardioides sp. TaxID=35761 RepID=UPI0039E510F4